ncbi:nicotinate (nicotinamide) nucleotide adenylyltransferase [Ramlibacter sp. PS4R-6]|uniref:nicotinate (nicotinamide) nucleotide adenylyltransferase n=1 Tax=Ramlibacter sp. PS4R-6 TaxID=3133438 RepID=UPI0030A5C905
MKIGMYGGAFDPPHNAHVVLAQAAVAQLNLDELRIFPTGSAWHRKHQPSAAEHRVAMARLAFDKLPKTRVDDREVKRAGPTYTIDTLRELRREFGESQLFLLMGADQAAAFTTWHEWGEIARIATLCVAHRGPAGALPAVPGATIVELGMPDMPESATDIRRKAARGEDISSLVPPGVAGYIASHHLYTQGN